MDKTIIKTSDKNWFKDLVEVYQKRMPATIIDDAQVGINPSADSLFAMGLKAKLSVEQWIAVGVSLGLSAAGIWMIITAVVDPEPTSKLGLLLGGGIVCVLGGGFSSIYILTKQRPPNVKIGPTGIEISWS